MNFKTELKRTVASVLSAIMIAGAFPAIGLADEPVYDYSNSTVLTGVTDGDPSTLPTYKLELFKEDPEGSGTLVPASVEDIDMDVSKNDYDEENQVFNSKADSFYIGVRMLNFDKFTSMKPYGLAALALTIDFDENYLFLEPTNGFIDGDTVKGRVKDHAGGAANSFYSRTTAAGKPTGGQTQNPRAYSLNATSGTSNDIANLIVSPGTLNNLGIVTGDEYLAFLEFVVIKVPENGATAFSLGRTSSDNSITLGVSTNKQALAYNAGSQLEKYLRLDESEVNIFPAGAAKKDGIAVEATNALSYKANENIKGITVKTHMSDDSTKDLPTGTEVKYYYSSTVGTPQTSSTTAAPDDMTGYTEITNTTALTTGVPKDANGKYLYVVADGYIACVGQLTVDDAEIDTIAVSGGSLADQIAGQPITFPDTMAATITYNNGKSGAKITYANFGANDLAVYTVNGSTYTLVDATSTYVLGNKANKFVVGKKDTMSGSSKKTSTEWAVTGLYDDVTVTAKTAPQLKYNENDNFDPSALVVTTKKKSETGTGTNTPYSTTPTDRWNVLNLKIVFAADANAAKTSTDYKDATSKIASGDIGKKVFVVVDNNGTKVATEVGTLAQKSGTTYAVSTQPTKMTYTYPETLDLTGIVFKATNPDDAAVNNKTYTLAEAQTAGIFNAVKIGTDTIVPGTTKLTKANSGKISFYKGETLVCESNAIAVSPKTLGLVRDGNDAITKVYDGKTAATVAVKVNADDVVSGDTVTGSVTGLTFNYNNKNVGTGKAITATGTPALTGLDANKYTLAAASTITGITGAITAKTLNITAISGISTKMNPDATADVVLANQTADQSKFTSADLVAGDKVTLTYTATFAVNDVKTSGDKNVTISATSLSAGDDKDNYTLGTIAAQGNVSDRTLASIAVDTTNAKLTYTYPDVTADFSGVKVTATYDNGTADVSDKATFSVTGKLSYGDTEVTVSYTEAGITKTATFTVKANKKKINVDTDLTFTATKAAGADTVTVTTDVKDGVIESGDEVTITAEGAFDDNTPGADKPVSITNIALTGAAADNYELDKTTGSGTGEITAGSQTAPEKVEATVDNKTNNITVTAPVGANVEYSIDGGTTWQNEPLFTGLTAGTEYTVQARFKATATEAASPAAETKVTTYKYHVTRAKKGSSKINDEIYTSEDTVASAADMNSKVFAKKPSSFKAYFTDSACKEEVEYPFTMKAETALFYTTSGGGGGGGGVSTYIVKFSAGKYGKIENNENQNIESGKTVTKLPTVIPNDGYKFVGWSVDGGKTVIDPSTEKITKATTLTAVYEEVEATPTPTATPLIKNNLKPYASGYDDGMFLPNDYITRAELASMIARLINGDDISESYRASFPDVDNTWYNKYIGYLEDKDVLSGYEDGTFRPNQTVTRGEMCAIIVRAQRYGLIPMDGMFTDVTDADWAKDYITTLASMNIVSGYEDGTFGTYSPITRAETVAIINRVLKPSTPVITFTPIDIAGHWAEADILLAVNERELIGSEPTVTPEATPEVTPEPEATVEPETTPDPEATPEATAEPTETPAA